MKGDKMSKWKYVDYSVYNSTDTFYNLRKIFSYNLPIMIIVGARGLGKSFSVKKYILEDYINNNHQFCWVRDTVEAVDELSRNNGRKFTEDIDLMRIENLKEVKIERGLCVVNGKIAGEFMPASIYQRYKGSSYQNVHNIVIDEFVPEKSTVRKISPTAIINTLSTIIRTRDEGRVFMMANSINRGDAFLETIGVELKDFGLYINRKAGVILHYSDNSAKFNALNSQGIVGKLLLNCNKMNYANNIMYANFNDDDSLIFETMPTKCKLLLILETPLQKARFYQCDGKLWVTPDVDSETYWNKRYVINLEDASAFKPVLPLDVKKKLKLYLQKNCVRYQSSFLKNFITEVFK